MGNRKIIDYIILEDGDTNILTKIVKEKIKENFQPFGEIVVTLFKNDVVEEDYRILYTQVMVVYEG